MPDLHPVPSTVGSSPASLSGALRRTPFGSSATSRGNFIHAFLNVIWPALRRRTETFESIRSSSPWDPERAALCELSSGVSRYSFSGCPNLCSQMASAGVTWRNPVVPTRSSNAKAAGGMESRSRTRGDGPGRRIRQRSQPELEKLTWKLR
jgi:hypothetical protein